MKRIIFIIIGILAVISLSVFIYLRSYLPDYSGELSVAGLEGPVTIERNQFAVPTIRAENRDDLYFAWGYVNAQDRMFQLEVTRRIAQGRISEFAGESTLKKDLFLRAVGFHRIAQTEIEKVDPVYRRYLKRYVDGINYYLEQEGTTLYMKLLGLEKETWTPADALSVGMMLNWTLAYNMSHEILYHKIARRIGPDRLRELVKDVPEDSPTIIEGYSAEQIKMKETFLSIMDEFGPLLGSQSASNNWVVADTKTAHNGVLFASDMQVHSNKLPNDFYLIRAISGDFYCAGAQVMGMPFITSGYNRNIAWGVTNSGADMVDLFRENIDRERKTWLFQDKEYPLNERKETFLVKGKGKVEKTIYSAGRRPLLTEVFDDLGFEVSLDWTAFDSVDFQGYFMINEAENWKEFRTATEKIRISPQNCVYADREGNIGYRVIGSLPVRKKGTGNIIQDGNRIRNNWDGNIPHDEYPEILNPDRGYIITANNRLTDRYPYDLNGTYAPRYRYDAIARMLKKKDNLNPRDMRTIQTDTHSVLAEKMKGIMKKYVKPGEDNRIKQALSLVMEWDGNVTRESVAASIYNTFYVRFFMQTIQDELGEELAEKYVAERYISMDRFFELLENDSGFFDDISTEKKESRENIATRAMNETLDLLEETTGSADMKSWKWGDIHVIRYDHFLGKSALLEPIVSYGPFPFEGDGETNNRARFKEVKPPYVGYLASAPRMVVRFDPEPRAWMMLITGENEYFMSPHRTDMITAWRNHEYFSVEESEVRYRMKLTPEKGD